MILPATHIPSNYPGIFMENIVNNGENVQNHKRKRHAEEGSSRDFHIAADYDGQDIDLNKPPKNV